MAYVKGGSMSFFSEETYQTYVEQKKPIVNERLRGEDETFFDALLSQEADITKIPEGQEVLKLIGSFK
jgi:hypothetical protein